MARNLQSKLKSSDKISIFDINPSALQGLEAEMKASPGGAAVELAASAFDASKDAVSSLPVLLATRFWMQCSVPFQMMSKHLFYL